MSFGVDDGIRLAENLLGLGMRVAQLAARGDAKRIEEIIPASLRSELAKAKADAELEDELAARRRMVDGLPGAGHQ